MKKTISMLLIATLLFSVFLAACGNPTSTLPEFYVASEITDDVQASANKVVSSFITAFEEENAKSALPLFSSGFNLSENELANFFNELAKTTSAPFIPYDAYYIKDLDVSDALIKVKKAESDGNYIELTPASREMYCAICVSEGQDVSYMMSLLLTKEGDDFKIAWVNPTDFKYAGNDAPALYEKTKALSDAKKTIPAYISSCMLSGVLRPGGYFRYENDIDMEDLCYKLHSEVSDAYALPLELRDTASSLYQIGITKDDEHGVVPLIMFKTTVPLSDDAKLRLEAKRVLSAIDELSPGISEVAEYVCFETTNDEISADVAAVKSKRFLLSIK